MGSSRRGFIAGAAAATVAATMSQAAWSTQTKPAKYRVGVIGHTGRGGYGHGLDAVWRDIPQAEIVGVADAHPGELAARSSGWGRPRATPTTVRCSTS